MAIFNLKEKILMNKLVSALLVAALATAGATAVSAADPLGHEASKATFKIDGVKDAGYGQAYKVGTLKDDSKKGATGLASFAWDDDYLCLCIISAEQTAFRFIHASTAAQFHKNGFSNRFLWRLVTDAMHSSVGSASRANRKCKDFEPICAKTLHLNKGI